MASQVEWAKRVPGTPFLVDGFRFQGPHCTHYFLTHAHSDHTTGLTRAFAAGVIYCTPITAAVLQMDVGLPSGIIRPLLLDETVEIAGVEVTPLDANHCPGACMFLFRVPHPPHTHTAPQQHRAILHTGDLRWHPSMATHPALLAASPLHTLLLDTTYCAPKWVFPPQEEAVGMLADMMRREAEQHPATLFVVGSYHIGKERAYLGAAHALGWRIHCPPAKRRLLRLLGLPQQWLDLVTPDAQQARIHVLGMGEQLHEQALSDRIKGTQWERVVAVRPTGWSFKKSGGLSRREYGCVTLVGVPYSEHSSFSELRDCVRALKPRRVIPTVNATDSLKARALVDLLADCMDLSTDKSRLDSYFRRGAQRAQQTPSGRTGELSMPSGMINNPWCTAVHSPLHGRSTHTVLGCTDGWPGESEVPASPTVIRTAAAVLEWGGGAGGQRQAVVWVGEGAACPESQPGPVGCMEGHLQRLSWSTVGESGPAGGPAARVEAQQKKQREQHGVGVPAALLRPSSLTAVAAKQSGPRPAGSGVASGGKDGGVGWESTGEVGSVLGLQAGSGLTQVSAGPGCALQQQRAGLCGIPEEWDAAGKTIGELAACGVVGVGGCRGAAGFSMKGDCGEGEGGGPQDIEFDLTKVDLAEQERILEAIGRGAAGARGRGGRQQGRVRGGSVALGTTPSKIRRSGSKTKLKAGVAGMEDGGGKQRNSSGHGLKQGRLHEFLSVIRK